MIRHCLKPLTVLFTFSLLLALLGTSRAHTETEVHGGSGKELATAKLMAVKFDFLMMGAGMQSPPAWQKNLKNEDLTLLAATPDVLSQQTFSPLQPYVARSGGVEWYVVNVFARGDRRQQPVYLYLLSKAHGKLRIAAAFEIVRGRPQKIAA